MEKQKIHSVGQKVKIVGDPSKANRFFAFKALIGYETVIIDVCLNDDNTVHQYGVKLGRGDAYFFPTEIEKIN